MTTPWYDDGAQICKRIDEEGLAGLVEVIRQREAAHYDRDERLEHSWILAHHFVTDTCGNLGRLDDEIGDRLERVADAPAAVRLDLGREVYGPRFPERISWSMGHRLSYAMPAERCDMCGRSWNLETAHDVSMECQITRHRWCERLRVFTNTLDDYDALLRRLGIVVPRVVIPNRYWPPGVHDASPPWISLRSKHGPVRIGRRKRVWDLNWAESEIEVEGATLVADPRTTHGPQNCHCWTEADLEAALRGLDVWVAAHGGWT